MFWLVKTNKTLHIRSGWGVLPLESNKLVETGTETIWFRRHPNMKGRGDSTHQPALANAPQRRQLVRNLFCLSLSQFPRHWVSSIIVIHQPYVFLFSSILFVSVLSPFSGDLLSDSCSNGTVCLDPSTSTATSAAEKGNKTEVTRTELILSFFTLSVFCFQF